jgi:hypothetical protein
MFITSITPYQMGLNPKPVTIGRNRGVVISIIAVESKKHPRKIRIMHIPPRTTQGDTGREAIHMVRL